MMRLPVRIAAGVVLLGAGCSSPIGDAVPPRDFALVYGWSSGSVPPPYNYSRRLTIEASGASTLEVRVALGPSRTWTFQTPRTDLSSLYLDLNEMAAFSRRWREDGNPPVGGPSAWLRVTANKTVTEIPTYVVRSQVEDAEAAFEAVERVIPAEIQEKSRQWLRGVQQDGEE